MYSREELAGNWLAHIVKTQKGYESCLDLTEHKRSSTMPMIRIGSRWRRKKVKLLLQDKRGKSVRDLGGGNNII